MAPALEAGAWLRRRRGIAAIAAAFGRHAGSPTASSISTFKGVQSGLCRFPVAVTVTTASQSDQPTTTVMQYNFSGPSTIRLRNTQTGPLGDAPQHRLVHRRYAHRQRRFPRAPGVALVDGEPRPVHVDRRHRGARRAEVPARAGPVDRNGDRPVRAPVRLEARRRSRARAAPPGGCRPTRSARSAYAGLTPVIGNLVRHDHVHLDVIVNGRHVTVPAGVGQAAPRDHGPCPPATIQVGDCTPGHVYAADVANSPIHTHSTSGIIHVEPDRAGTYTLGSFFDEWGVRFTSALRRRLLHRPWQAAARLRERQARHRQPAADRAWEPAGDRGDVRRARKLPLGACALPRRLAGPRLRRPGRDLLLDG